MFNGINEYLFKASFKDGTIITKKITLLVDYQRIQIADMVLYVDAGYIPADETDSVMREAPDFEGESTHFITYGCDVSKNAPPLLIQD